MSKSYIVTARQCRIMHVLISACPWVMAHYHSLGSLEYLVFYIYIYIYRGARFRYRCCSLGFSLKILPCGFFLIDESVFFKISNHMVES